MWRTGRYGTQHALSHVWLAFWLAFECVRSASVLRRLRAHWTMKDQTATADAAGGPLGRIRLHHPPDSSTA
jgi:hypothetical protein